jgi:hypothetical protein
MCDELGPYLITIRFRVQPTNPNSSETDKHQSLVLKFEKLITIATKYRADTNRTALELSRRGLPRGSPLSFLIHQLHGLLISCGSRNFSSQTHSWRRDKLKETDAVFAVGDGELIPREVGTN